MPYFFCIQKTDAMLRNLLFLLPIVGLSLAGCNTPTAKDKGHKDKSPFHPMFAGGEHGLQLLMTDDAGWQCGSLRLYPITLTEEAMAVSKEVNLPLLTLAEAMQTDGFQIVELKEFGRSNQVWYHGLTVLNKTKHPVLLMAGDVVQGGNQDRVIAQDEIIAADSIRNIEVFCVEQGRSFYYNPEASEAEERRGAFYGYHSVCSPSVRSQVFRKEQDAIWKQVAQVTQANQANTATGAYTAIGNDQDATTKARLEGCVKALEAQFYTLPNVVGYVAVNNHKVVSVEIFRTPDLFHRRLTPLLKGLAAEAIAGEAALPKREPNVWQAFERVAKLAQAGAQPTEYTGKTTYAGTWVHLYSKW